VADVSKGMKGWGSPDGARRCASGEKVTASSY